MIMAPTQTKTDSIIVVGAGVFGLSTALHLAQRGYTKVTVLDKTDYDETLYDYELGCDAASAGQYPQYEGTKIIADHGTKIATR